MSLRRSSAFTSKRYYTLGSINVAVRDSAGGGSLHYLLGDQLGSTTVSVNAAGGTPVVQRYLPYGAPRSTSGGSAVTDRGWIGQTKDGSTGLQYLNARYYDPNIGRFAATDPVVDTRQTGSLDRYGYGYDSPVTLSDPSGLWVPVGSDSRSGSHDAWREPRIDDTTGQITKTRLPGRAYTKIRLELPGTDDTELPGCDCEEGNVVDRLVDLASNKTFWSDAHGLATGAQVVYTVMECSDGGGNGACYRAIIEVVVVSTGGRVFIKAASSLGKAGTAVARARGHDRCGHLVCSNATCASSLHRGRGHGSGALPRRDRRDSRRSDRVRLLVILGIAGVATAAVELFQVWSIREQKGYGDWAFMTAIGCGLVGAGLLVTAALVTLAGALL